MSRVPCQPRFLHAMVCAAALVLAAPSMAAVVVSPLNGHEYEVVFAEGSSWESARAAALARGAGWDLASIGDASENAFVKSLLDVGLPSRSHFWLGASDREVEGQWTWLDGTPFSYTDWAPNEPNNLGDEDFLSYDLVPSGWAWNDAPDNLHEIYGFARGYVIEHSVPEPTTPGLLAVALAASLAISRRRPARRRTSLPGCQKAKRRSAIHEGTAATPVVA